jgi:hypothetical protein
MQAFLYDHDHAMDLDLAYYMDDINITWDDFIDPVTTQDIAPSDLCPDFYGNGEL